VVDFSGPHGWELGGVNAGRLKAVTGPPVAEVGHAIRDVRPLVEQRSPIMLSTLEVDYAARGANDLDLDAVIAAAERVARAEDAAIFHGFNDGNITGMIEASPHAPIDVKSSLQWPRADSAAKEVLRLAGVNGPYALVVGVEAYDELSADSDDGYPLSRRFEETLVPGSPVWAPALEHRAVLLSVRGGDYELTVGQGTERKVGGTGRCSKMRDMRRESLKGFAGRADRALAPVGGVAFRLLVLSLCESPCFPSRRCTQHNSRNGTCVKKDGRERLSNPQCCRPTVDSPETRDGRRRRHRLLLRKERGGAGRPRNHERNLPGVC
jgi:uncharacterized linocin/CFP29 family protein